MRDTGVRLHTVRDKMVDRPTRGEATVRDLCGLRHTDVIGEKSHMPL